MDTSELVDVLRDADLSPYQADAYVTLLGMGTVPAQELAAASDVPRPRIYDVLESLEEAGYVVTYERDQLYVEAVPPDRGLAGLETRIDRLRDAVVEIESRWERPVDESVDITVVKQFETVRYRSRDRIETAEWQVRLALTYEQYLHLEPTLRAAYRRGITVNVLLHYSEDGAPSSESFEGICTEARENGAPCQYEPFLVIVDGETVNFAPFAREPPQGHGRTPSREPTPRYGVIVHDPIHAHVFEMYFLAALWNPSTVLYAGRDDGPPVTFVDVRELILMVDPLLRDGAAVKATVEGRAVRSGRERTVSGDIVAIETDTSAAPDGAPTESTLTRGATVVLETDQGTVTVGGRGATLEDVEATHVTVTEVASPERE